MSGDPIAFLPGIPVMIEPEVALTLPRYGWQRNLGIGPCMRCGTSWQRYGPGGSPVCTDCQREVEIPAVGVHTSLAHNCIGCGQWFLSGSVMFITPYGYRCPDCYSASASS